MRLKFFKRSAKKVVSRIDPDDEVHRDLRVIFPGACPGVNTILLIQDLFSQEEPAYKMTKLVDGIYEPVADGGGYPVKVIVSVGDDGILIVDSGNKKSSREHYEKYLERFPRDQTILERMKELKNDK